jgi:hypothetical protein
MVPPEESRPRRRWQGCDHTQVEPPHDCLPLVGCYVGLDLPCVGVLPRCVGCVGLWHDSCHVWALICLVTGPLFFGYVQDGNTLCMIAYSCHISMLFM